MQALELFVPKDRRPPIYGPRSVGSEIYGTFGGKEGSSDGKEGGSDGKEGGSDGGDGLFVEPDILFDFGSSKALLNCNVV